MRCPVHRQDDLVGEPVAPEIHQHGKSKSDDEPLIAAKPLPDPQDQPGQQAEEQRRFEHVGHRSAS
jgi:hypothetical protein